MVYRGMRDCVEDLERHGHLVRVPVELSPHLEMAEIQRRLYEVGGPAVLYERVAGSPFPAVSNLFGTLERCRFLFRDTLDRVQQVLRLKADPTALLRHPFRQARAPFTALGALPREVRGGPVLDATTTADALPAVVSWPRDGGPFITLPQVLTEHPDNPGPLGTNLGMYRVQMAGNDYAPGREMGLHYQIHRGIGAHHAAAIARDEKLRVSVFVGGPPAHTFAAVMPLPEGISELTFAGMLAGRRFRWTRRDGHFLSVDADFCLVGTVDPRRTLPEGPFGDHLGYYAETHQFPVFEVERIYHRRDAVWPFTVVGRPPQEDTTFGAMIHEFTGPLVPTEIPGLHAMHAVDEAGVHPLLLALGSERYVPYRAQGEGEGRPGPQELLTLAHAILGFGQASLAKYLMIVAREDAPDLDLHDVGAVLQHLLARIDWRRDLHFHTRTTMDTLDYSGAGLNAGSKVVMAAAGPPIRSLATALPNVRLPDGFREPRLVLPGVAVVGGPPFTGEPSRADVQALADAVDPDGTLVESLPLLVVVDDPDMTARSLRNFLWVTFTRSNPSHDIDGVRASTTFKHWGCAGPLLIDARIKPHHAAPLVEDPAVTRRIDALAAPGGPLHGIL